jgi:putative FmdB family regulatory protein
VPTYQYQCTECGNALEVRQSFTDDALTVCPSCDGTLRKVFNAVGVVFKGSGFYRTDSRSSATSGSPAAGRSDTKTETKTETKSDKKSDSTKSTTSSSTTSSSAA